MGGDGERTYEELCELARGMHGRIEAVRGRELDDSALCRLANDLAVVTQFSIEADLYQRPDEYVFRVYGLKSHAVRDFLAGLLRRHPERRAGYLARLASYHGLPDPDRPTVYRRRK
jgi:hypothetical protein